MKVVPEPSVVDALQEVVQLGEELIGIFFASYDWMW
jgi:hypothetical protein